MAEASTKTISDPRPPSPHHATGHGVAALSHISLVGSRGNDPVFDRG
jgi:hypothetical protein